jgi:hypothetical protein
LEGAVVVAHLHGAWTLWPDRVWIQERILPTDKFGQAYPLASVVGMCAWLAAYAAALAILALTRRWSGRAGALLESLWVATPAAALLAFWFGWYEWTVRGSPLGQSGALAIWWAPGALKHVWLLLHPVLGVLLLRSSLRARPGGP